MWLCAESRIFYLLLLLLFMLHDAHGINFLSFTERIKFYFIQQKKNNSFPIIKTKMQTKIVILVELVL